LKEAAKLGFERGWIPASLEAPGAMATTRFAKLSELVDQIIGRG
jgi:DNA repair protein RadA/Sms